MWTRLAIFVIVTGTACALGGWDLIPAPLGAATLVAMTGWVMVWGIGPEVFETSTKEKTP